MNELILPKNIICGYFDCSIFGDLKISPVRTRTLYEIEYYLEDGRLSYTDGIAYPIKKGYVRIGAPGECCNSLLPFKTKYVKFSAEGHLAALLSSAPRYFRAQHPNETEAMLDDIISAYQSPEQDSLLLCGRLLIFLSAILGGSMRSREDPVSKAKAYIELHFSESLSLSDMAREVRLSPNYFHTLFRDSVGMTPREYLTEYRLRVAGQLLSTTSLPLSLIAEKCGFCNQQYMSSLFKKKFRISPITYRKKSERNYLI